MHVFGHDYGGVKFVAGSVIVEAVLEDGVAGLWWEGVAIVFAEGDEEASSCGLIVREVAVVFVLSVEWGVGRTVLSGGGGSGFHKTIADEEGFVCL
jgi:hypothetical protein